MSRRYHYRVLSCFVQEVVLLNLLRHPVPVIVIVVLIAEIWNGLPFDKTKKLILLS